MIQNTNNPIRKIVDQIKIKPHEDYPMIALSIGDPSVYGNFEPPPEAIAAIEESIKCGKNNGYGPSMGIPTARKAVADYMKQFFKYEIDINDIALASGASGALEFAISAIAERGDNILLPRYEKWNNT